MMMMMMVMMDFDLRTARETSKSCEVSANVHSAWLNLCFTFVREYWHFPNRSRAHVLVDVCTYDIRIQGSYIY